MHRTIKSFVLRAGRMSPRQQQGFDQWLKDYQLRLEDTPWDFKTIFGRSADTIVEIGFGMGQSLLAMASANPDTNYIGIEVHRAGLGSLAADLQEQKLNNVRLAAQDAIEIFKAMIPESSLSGIQIYFPDPWPKKRHHKRRLIQPEFIHRAAQKLKPGGFLHCATDWQEYAEHMLAVLSEESLLINASQGYSPRPAYRPITKFEQRGQRLGHGVWDLLFTRLK